MVKAKSAVGSGQWAVGRKKSRRHWSLVLGHWSFAIALFVTATAEHARADAGLDEGLAKLATSVAKFLQDENRGNAVNVGDFIAPPRLQSSGGRGLSEAIAQAFKKHKIDVRTDATIQLIGKFSVREEKESAESEFESVALRLRAEVLDNDDQVLQAFNISVFGSAAPQVAGITAELPPKAGDQERQAEIKERLDKPQAAIVGSETRASDSSLYGVEVLVNRMPRKPELTGGRSFVPLERGEEYIIRLHNHSKHDAAVILTIDGLGMFAFSKEDNFGSKVIVLPGSFADIPGWYVTSKETAAFLITSYPDSAAGKKNASTNVGTITASFSAAWDPEKTPPDDEPLPRGALNATGLGRAIAKKYEQVNRVVSAQTRAVVSVRYNR